MGLLVIFAPTGDLERAHLAHQPAYSLFAFFLCLQVTLAAALQVASVPFGLIFSEVFLFAAPVVLWSRGANWTPISFLKLRPPPRGLTLLGFMTGAANFLIAGALQAAARAVLPARFIRTFDATRLFEGASGSELGVLIASLAVVAPVCEEIAFRGYLQTVLRARYRDAAAVVITAVLFALLHLDPVGLVARIELGVVFGLLVLWTGSLWPAVAAHAANNIIAGAILLSVVHRHPETDNPANLGPALFLGLGGALALALVLTSVRHAAARAGAATPPLETIEPSEDHGFHLARIRRPVAVWILCAAVFVAAFLVLNVRSARVSFIDAATPLQEITRQLPDEESRRALTDRLHAEHHRARDGSLDLESYRALRKRLTHLARKRENGSSLTLADVDSVLREADAGAKLAVP